jgi:hypothetical protein
MIERLKKIFKASPEKSTIILKDKCSDCGCDVVIKITSTSGGYGLQGGALLGCSTDGYFVKCPKCYRLNPRIADIFKPKCVHVH